jgi:hypothetical protein
VTATIVGFVEARRRAFLHELHRINVEFRARRDSVRAWPPQWFENERHRADAQGQGFLIAIIQRLKRCIAAAKRYGVNATPFEKALKRRTPDKWETLKLCAPRDWDNPVIASHSADNCA